MVEHVTMSLDIVFHLVRHDLKPHEIFTMKINLIARINKILTADNYATYRDAPNWQLNKTNQWLSTARCCYWYAFTNEMQLGTWSFYDFDVHHGNNSKVFEPGNCNVKFN